MRVTNAYSFLVHPSKHEQTQPTIGGTEISLTHEVGVLLSSAFVKAANDCSIDISFNMSPDGRQSNAVRELIINLLRNTGMTAARAIAEHLQEVTTNRSGLGLLFVLTGESDDKKTRKIYIARFPADNGIVAEEKDEELQVDFLEQVFMKSAYSYKAALYEGSSLSSDFWEGKAIDKQVSNRSISISGYWIKDFLESDFKTTSALGTRRFAQALKETISRTTDLSVKEELTAVATLAKNFSGKVISVQTIAKTFGLTSASEEALTETLHKPEFAFTKFKFSLDEFRKHVKFRQLQLSNGATLSAPAGKFDQVFERAERPNSNGEVKFTTVGKVIDENLKKTL